MVRVAILGPESSGKSTLAQDLAHYYSADLIEEFAREYLNDRPSYDKDDLKFIAGKQFELAHVSKMSDKELLISDTEMIVMKIWFEEKFHEPSEDIEHLLSNQRFDLYLLTKPDIPWEYDPLRENREDRDRLFNVYRRTLEEYRLSYIIVKGSDDERFKIATSAIDSLLSNV